MTENQTNQLVKNPNTKKAIAVLQKYAKSEAALKALEKEMKEASKQITEAMIASNVEKITFDPESGVEGYITLVNKTTYKAEDIQEVDVKYLKSALDTDKVKAEAVLTGKLPDGVIEVKSQHITKKFKVTK